MELYLTKNSLADTNLTDASGRTVYAMSTLSKLMSRTTTISRAASSSAAPPSCVQNIAQIEWHSIRRSKLTYAGQTYDFPKLLRKSWCLCFVCRVVCRRWADAIACRRTDDRTFDAPDGRAYTWKTYLDREEVHNLS